MHIPNLADMALLQKYDWRHFPFALTEFRVALVLTSALPDIYPES